MSSLQKLPDIEKLLKKDVGKLSKRKLLQLVYSMQVQILAQIGGIKQQLDILANADFLQQTMKEREKQE